MGGMKWLEPLKRWWGYWIFQNPVQPVNAGSNARTISRSGRSSTSVKSGTPNRNPDRYLDAEVYRGDDNNIVIELSNNAEFPAEVVEVQLLKMRDFRYERIFWKSSAGRYSLGRCRRGDCLLVATV